MKLRSSLLRIAMITVGTLMISFAANAQETPEAGGPNLMPWPAKIQTGTGSLKIDSSFSVAVTGYREARLDRAVERFLGRLHRQTAIVLLNKKASEGDTATLVIHTDHASKDVQELGEDESYSLEVTPAGAKLSAANPLGVLRGLQTFLQLVDVSPEGFGFAAPAVSIQDTPRFAWRGLMIDVARHFIPLDVLKRNLDGMEAVKLNVFHWHLSDNQGFRVESKKFPKLQEMGSDGMFYTQDEVKELIEYARDRGIRVVPEFDMPGHSTAWFVGYPELASGPGPYQIERGWGVFDPAMNPAKDETYKFLDTFIGEMAKLFPDEYFHIGGDEVNGKEWDANAKVQEFKKEHNLTSNEEFQAYFSSKVQKLVEKHGKTTIGWDEVLVPGAPKAIVIQSWRGQESLSAAAKGGYRGILSNGYYLDLGWSAARHYAVDPMGGAAANLTADEKKQILGGEACMWAEYVSPENIDSRIWPRTAAIAERFWSPQSVTDPASMYARMDDVSQKLEWIGLTHRTYYRKMLQRIAGPATAEEFAALDSLAGAVEPVKNYTRERNAPFEPTSLTAMNRIVDAVPLESDRARRFNELADRYVDSKCGDKDSEKKMESQLLAWSKDEEVLGPLMIRSGLLKEGQVTAHVLATSAGAGYNALNFLKLGATYTEEQKKAVLDALKFGNEQASHAQLTLAILPGIQKLVEVATAPGVCRVPPKW